jgi:DNA mismatch endonuclease (patch repair protein)
MAAIRSKDSKPELQIRRGLFALGHRHRLGWKYKPRGKYLPGKPDLVLPGRRAVIFVNGCFWHGHGCYLFKWPKTEDAFWRDKILGNVARDQRARTQLRLAGWRIAEVWECTLKGLERWPAGEVLALLDRFIRSDAQRLVIGPDQTVTVSHEA